MVGRKAPARAESNEAAADASARESILAASVMLFKACRGGAARREGSA